jgi:hypothetical protein
MRIEALQKESVQVEDEIAEKQHYTRQLEHVLLRLKNNQLKFDAHMVGMEEAMNAIMKEGNEVRLLRRGLDAGLAKAIAVLEETELALASSRKDRQVLIEQRRSEVKNAVMLKVLTHLLTHLLTYSLTYSLLRNGCENESTKKRCWQSNCEAT